ncbi:unnamed protein product [Musa textilis]
MTDPSDVSAAAAAGGFIPDLPDDIAVRCIARVPRSHHPALALVSRSWRSLLRSPLLSAVRSHLAVTDPPVLALNLRSPTDQSPWFLLDPLLLRRSGKKSPPPLRLPHRPSLLSDRPAQPSAPRSSSSAAPSPASPPLQSRCSTPASAAGPSSPACRPPANSPPLPCSVAASTPLAAAFPRPTPGPSP